MDVKAVFAAFQGFEQERLRFQQADQPDIRDPFRHPVALGQFRADLVVVTLAQSIEHVQVGQFKPVQVIPAIWVGFDHGSHRREIMTITGSAQLIAQLHQLFCELLRLVEREVRCRLRREQGREVRPREMRTRQHLYPRQQAGLLRRHVYVAITPIQELVRGLEFRQK